MDKFPLYWNGQAVGEVTTEEEPLYTRFSACCRLPAEALWCVWLIGKQGELRLGVIEPNGAEAVLPAAGRAASGRRGGGVGGGIGAGAAVPNAVAEGAAARRGGGVFQTGGSLPLAGASL